MKTKCGQKSKRRKDLGRSIDNPFGIQLTLLTISIGGLLAMICFSFYPEKDVLDSLRIHEDKLIEEINKEI